jgi:hypothetical protein
LEKKKNGKHVDDLTVAHRTRKHGPFVYPKCGLMFKRNAEISSQFVSLPNSVTQPVLTAQKQHRGGQSEFDGRQRLGLGNVSLLFNNRATGN